MKEKLAKMGDSIVDYMILLLPFLGLMFCLVGVGIVIAVLVVEAIALPVSWNVGPAELILIGFAVVVVERLLLNQS